MKNKNTSIGLQGGSSLMVIFGVLCLVVFSVLTLSSSQATSRLQNASVEATNSYYEADCLAEEKLSELRLKGQNGTYTYDIDISDSQALHVSVKITDDDYKILSWQTVYTANWEADDSLLLWDRNS